MQFGSTCHSTIYDGHLPHNIQLSTAADIRGRYDANTIMVDTARLYRAEKRTGDGIWVGELKERWLRGGRRNENMSLMEQLARQISIRALPHCVDFEKYQPYSA